MHNGKLYQTKTLINIKLNHNLTGEPVQVSWIAKQAHTYKATSLSLTQNKTDKKKRKEKKTITPVSQELHLGVPVRFLLLKLSLQVFPAQIAPTTGVATDAPWALPWRPHWRKRILATPLCLGSFNIFLWIIAVSSQVSVFCTLWPRKCATMLGHSLPWPLSTVTQIQWFCQRLIWAGAIILQLSIAASPPPDFVFFKGIVSLFFSGKVSLLAAPAPPPCSRFSERGLHSVRLIVPTSTTIVPLSPAAPLLFMISLFAAVTVPPVILMLLLLPPTLPIAAFWFVTLFIPDVTPSLLTRRSLLMSAAGAVRRCTC